MGAIRGSDFIVSIELNGVQVPVCYATDCQINRTFDTKEISGPQGRDRDYISDYRGYTISIPLLIVYDQIYNYSNFSEAAEAGLKIKWFASAFENGGVIYSGEALITEIDLTSQMRDVMKSDVTILGCGTFKTDYLPVNKTVYLSDFDKVQLPGCPNAYPISVFWYDFTLIGPATTPDEVVQLFNDYSATHGNYYKISVGDGGCKFNMEIAYNTPQPYPDTIFAQQGADFAISTDQMFDNVLSTDQNDNNVLTPIGNEA